MTSEWHGGKGSGRRKEDAQKVSDNWDLIFGKKQTMIEDEIEEHDEDDSEWTCDVCGGPMYHQAHWKYARCDDCGARQELVDDF